MCVLLAGLRLLELPEARRGTPLMMSALRLPDAPVETVLRFAVAVVVVERQIVWVHVRRASLPHRRG